MVENERWKKYEIQRKKVRKQRYNIDCVDYNYSGFIDIGSELQLLV